MSFKTSYKRVSGLGSAKDGTRHWWVLRLSSIALVPLSLLFVYTFSQALGGDHMSVLETYSNPWNALVAIMFLLVGFHHLRDGLQVVIEDYVHGKSTRTVLLVLNFLLCWGFAIIGVFAVARISLVAG